MKIFYANLAKQACTGTGIPKSRGKRDVEYLAGSSDTNDPDNMV